MALKPQQELTEGDVKRGLRMVIWDGLASEVVTSLTGGAFLVAMALLLGANNVQIGLLAALPMITNVFQLLSIMLVRKYQNRRAISVVCIALARIPLAIIGLMVLRWQGGSINMLIFFLFFHFFFSSVSGLSWNSWMKDMIPEKMLGKYFSRRSRYTQTLNVALSIILALLLDFIRSRYPAYELTTFAVFFIIAGAVGLVGAYFLSRAPEPQSYLSKARLFTLLKMPLKNENFRRLLVFNSAWVFALNIATPFFTVFMLQGMGLPLSYIIVLTIISQLSSIMTLRMWGIFSDRYSNKSIIAISAPVYILCIIAWSFVGIYSIMYINLGLLVLIHMFSGISTAGINLSLTNIGLKLAPKEDAIVYLSVKNIVTAVFSALGPLLGGVLADYFAERTLEITFEWNSPDFDKTFKLVSLHQWNFLFLIGAFLALCALELLGRVKETGEVGKDIVKRIMRKRLKSNMKDAIIIGNLITWNNQLRAILKLRKKRTVTSSVSPDR
ncbi:MFS transporter [Parapedobacter sp. ISTM3]|uniref:MFS transporter n=1 Tax=Parapedobacter sp. ISTM3 TaxID=2800130 RepID=UPI001904F863|nr:MFS transporter [Parapedobacter sp. ISTM3]MBK1441586.1 MFS transporter [Parapedobacter sp. ISTM3]